MKKKKKKKREKERRGGEIIERVEKTRVKGRWWRV